MRILIIISLLSLVSCKGTRFYWETKFQLPHFKETDRKTLIKTFDLTGDLTSWHPVYGRYCTSLKSAIAHVFVCLKNDELRIVSSYPGILKGDSPVSTNQATINKYLTMIESYPGHAEHKEIAGYVQKKFSVKSKRERLLTYGKGSLIIKKELAEEL